MKNLLVLILIFICGLSFGIVEKVADFPEGGGHYEVEDVGAEGFIISVRLTHSETMCSDMVFNGIAYSVGFAGGYFLYPMFDKRVTHGTDGELRMCPTVMVTRTYDAVDVYLNAETGGTSFMLPAGMEFLGLRLQ